MWTILLVTWLLLVVLDLVTFVTRCPHCGGEGCPEGRCVRVRRHGLGPRCSREDRS